MQVFAQGKVCPDAKGSKTNPRPLNRTATKIMRIMKLTVLLLTVAFLQVNANGYSQTITYSGKNVPLEKIFTVIKEQAGFGFIYFDEQLEGAKKVTINVKNATVENVLAICMKDQPYDYTIKAKTIFIINRQKKETADIKVSAEQQKGKRINISGRVTGEQGEPVAGATITVKGTDVATSTNDKGVFYLNDVDEDAVLVVTYISYQVQEVALRGRSNLDVKLKIGGNDLDEAMVVAYNTTSKRMNTGAVSVVKAEQIQTLPNRSFDRSLQGLVPGLLVTPGNGQPGAGVSNFVLRGIATAASTEGASIARNPLIVIDGVPVSQEVTQLYTDGNIRPISNPLAQLNPSDIATITVLKDASAVALYGARASNGVILVTTKKGKGKTTINFRHQTDFASRIKPKYDVLNQNQYLELLFETYRNSGYSNEDSIRSELYKIYPYQVYNSGDTSFYPAANWDDAIYRNNATTISNELSISGGTENTNYYLNLEYTKQDGIVKGSGFDRKSFRFNFENQLAKWFKAGTNTALSYSIQNYAGPARNSLYMGLLARMSPLVPVRLNDGNYYMNYREDGADIANPAASAEYNTNRNRSFRGLSKVYGEINFLKAFSFTSTLGIDYMQSEIKEKGDPRLFHSSNSGVQPGSANAGIIEELDGRTSNMINNNILRFKSFFNRKHTLDLLVGQEAQILSRKNLSVAVNGLQFPYYDEISSPGVKELRRGGSSFKETLLSYFGQANYAFDGKYFLSGSIRRDGSSRFGEDRKFGTYWSMGAGWIVTQESFMKNLPFLNFLKLRGSIGEAGNAAAIDAYTRFDRLNVGNYMGGISISSGRTPGNPDIQWENTFTWDAGVEGRLWKERIGFTLDFYKRKTNKLVYLTELAQSTGYVEVLSNIGKMENRGVELSVSVDVVKSSSIVWNIRGNWSTNMNKLTEASVPLQTLSKVVNKVGEPFNSFYMVRWAGVDPADGMPQWLDSLGKITKTYNFLRDRVLVGKPQPDGFGSVSTSFSYRNFELSAMFYYQYGYQIYLDENRTLINDGSSPFINQSTAALDRWQKPGDNAAAPKRTLNNFSGLQQSTRFLVDGDHIRFQNLSIAYTVPKGLTNGIGLNFVRIYVQGNNIALWSKYDGNDPANINADGNAEFAYPNQKSFSVGVNVNF
ncbi:SusC/RagA family TonB-linked outer membrane protein [Niastella populi]|uniref:SusC/RagA family TonB-linked outer membrane protein n=1 Tax=Niastella populi TaxID=550983 RepID=A0A1V9GAY5_9BACT|nr:SusC/RagA family TonB-linked outer membrane protein [Niastella populi]OQP67606.1 hypothetical protein A4R26_12400 [Niastella populi]